MKKVSLFFIVAVGLIVSVAAEQCQAITQKGRQCRRNASPGSKYCWQHDKKTQESKRSNDNRELGEARANYLRQNYFKLKHTEAPESSGTGSGWKVEDMPTCKAKNEDGSSCTKKCYGGTGYCCKHSHLAQEDPLVRTKNKMKEIELWIRKSGEYRPRTLKELRIQSASAPSPFDGWRMELSYVTDGADYVLSSAGPDMKFETADDITILHKDGKSRFINEK